MPMPDSIKLQIMNRILANFEPLKTAGTLRSVTRERNLLLAAAVFPALQIYDSPERLESWDTRGRTFHFDLCLKLAFMDQRDLGGKKDELVPQIQQIIEKDIQ